MVQTLDFEHLTVTIWAGLLALMAVLAIWFFRSIRQHRNVSESDWQGQLEIIEYFSQSVFRRNTPEDIVWDIAASCIEKLGLEDCVIYLKHDVRHVWVQKAAYGPKNVDYRSIHEPIDVPFGKGIVGRVGRTGVAEIVDDTSADADYVVDDAIRGSELAVPILCDGEVIGVIDTEHSLKGFFQPFHLRILESIALICGQKIGRSLGEARIREYAKFYEVNPNPVARIDRSGLILLSNEAAAKAFGRSFREGKRLKPSSALMLMVEAMSPDAMEIQGQIEEGSEVYQVILRWVEGTSFCHLYAVDVTDLEEARERAAGAEQHKSEFLSVMSHEIRTPLNGILGLIELMMRGPLSEEERLSHLSHMEFAGKHLKGLLTDVLDLERLGTGKAQPNPVRFQPRELLKRIVNGFDNRAKATQNTLSLTVEEGVPRVLVGDVGWVTQMLNNLVSNALKFTDKGSIKCTAFFDKDGLRLTVEDTGKGIPEQDLDRILQPFEQVHRDQINVVNQGVGLGLAITKRLIDLSSGSFEVKSLVGLGSTFVIRLPLTADEDQTSPVEKPVRDIDLGATISTIPDVPVLVVDDNELNILVARKMIENWGYEVVVAGNVDVAEAQVEAHRPFMVLLDIHMPGRDGFQAVSEWRAKPAPWSDLTVVGLTADAETHTREQALEAGMNEVVIKPFSPPHLRSIIESGARFHEAASGGGER